LNSIEIFTNSTIKELKYSHHPTGGCMSQATLILVKTLFTNDELTSPLFPNFVSLVVYLFELIKIASDTPPNASIRLFSNNIP
jgi:hypothetical protein